MPHLSVPDMSCGHCKASVEAALGAVAGMAPVEVDLPNRRVSVGGAAAIAAAALEKIGFPATEISAP